MMKGEQAVKDEIEFLKVVERTKHKINKRVVWEHQDPLEAAETVVPGWREEDYELMVLLTWKDLNGNIDIENRIDTLKWVTGETFSSFRR